MKVVRKFRPISVFEANTADIVRELQEEAGPIVITQDGIPSFVCVSFEEYYRAQETNALLKIVHIGQEQIAEGSFKPIAQARTELNQRILGRRGKT